MRALINNCAQMNVITLQTMHRVGIKPTEAPNSKNRVNQKNALSTHGRMNLTILPKPGNNFSFLYGVGKHQGSLASKYTNRSHRATKVSNFNLANSVFDKPNTTDLLLGQSVSTHIKKSWKLNKSQIYEEINHE